MTIWAAVILGIALILAFLNLLQGFKTGKPNLQDIVMFLVALGVLIRIRAKIQEAEKEKLEDEIRTVKETNRVTAVKVMKKKAPAKKKAAPKKTSAKKKTTKKKTPAKKMTT